MKKSNRPGLFAVILVVVVAGAFVGLATAHDAGGDQTHDDCEMAHGADECPMDGMMGGMMQMGDECPMDNTDRMMGGMHGDSSAEGHNHDDCSMH